MKSEDLYAVADDSLEGNDDGLVGENDNDHEGGDDAADDNDDDGVAQDEDKLYLCVSSPTIKDKPVRVNLIQEY